MNFSRSNIALTILLLIVAYLAVLIGVDHSQPNYEFLPDMKRSPAWSAYSANPNFANQRTLQAPVAGTIARGDLPLYFEATKEDAVRAGEELQNPFALKFNDSNATPTPEGERPEPAVPADTPDANAEADSTKNQAKLEAAARERLRKSVQRGTEVYRVFCISCHGPSGGGDGPVTKRGFPPPPPLTTGKSAQMKDGQLFHILTYGQGNMAKMSAQLSRDRRWDAINYVRSLQKNAAKSRPKIPTEPAKPEESGQ